MTILTEERTTEFDNLGDIQDIDWDQDSAGELGDDPYIVSDLTLELQQATQELEENGDTYESWRPDADFVSRLSHRENNNYTTKQVRELVRAGSKWLDVFDAKFPDKIDAPTRKAQESIVLELISQLKHDTLYKIYADPDNGGRELRNLIDIAVENNTVHPAATLLRRIYKCDDAIKLTNYAKDPSVHKLLLEPAVITEITGELREKLANTKHMTESEREALDDKADLYLHSFVEYYLGGLPDKMKTDIDFTAWPRLLEYSHKTKTSHITQARFDAHLEPALRAIQLAGKDLETTKKLREKAGVVNFDYRTPQQLELLSKFIDGDQETIKRLQEGDVTVVFLEEMNDYNGSMSSLKEVYDTASQRTLIFGLVEPADMYRYMLMLRDRGVKPSTIALGLHGNRGRLVLGSHEDKFTISNDEINPSTKKDKIPSDKAFLPMAKAVARIVDEFMQDSRGIDDNKDAIGRRRIILNSCFQASLRRVNRYRKNAAGKIDRRFTRESFAHTLATVAKSPSLDVVAAADSVATVSRDDGRSMQYIGVKGDDKRTSYNVPAVSHRLDDAGNVITESHAEYKLHKEAMPVKKDVDKLPETTQ